MERPVFLLALLSTLTPACATAVPGGGGASADAADVEAQADGAPGSESSDGGPSQGASCDDVPLGFSRVGPPIEPTGGVFDMGDIAIDREGRPVVVVSGGSPADGYLYRFENGAWQQLGTTLNVNESGGVYDMSVRVMGDDIVTMFLESGGETSTGVYVQRLPGGQGAWEVMGGGDLSTTNANVVGSDIVVDGDELLVAWSQYSEGVIGRSRVHVRRFQGDAYVPLSPFMGGIAGPGASAITPSIVVDGTGKEVVFFSESGVRHLERNAADTDWTLHPEVDPNLSSSSGFGPHAAVDGLGRVLMAMSQYDQAVQQSVTYLQRWNGTSWDAMGRYEGLPAEGSHAIAQDLLVANDDRAVIAVTEPASSGEPAKLSIIRRTSGDAFEVLGGAPLVGGDGTQPVLDPRLAADPCGFHVAFAERTSEGADLSLHVFRWRDE